MKGEVIFLADKTKRLTYGGVCIALSMVLSYVAIYKFPQGGAVTAGSMVPIILYGLIFGWKDGILCAVAYGLLQLAVDAKIYHWASVFLDYIFAYGALGFAGFFKDKKYGYIKGTIAACFGRFFFSFISGWVLFGAWAPEGMNPAVYSLEYNAGYMIPELIISLVIIIALYPKLSKRKLS